MATYYVQVTADFYKGYSVEADSEEDAAEQAIARVRGGVLGKFN